VIRKVPDTRVAAAGRPATVMRRRAEDQSSSWASSSKARSRMQSQRARDTAPELKIRRLLYSAGMRYQVDRAPIVGLKRRADILFGSSRVAVFIDGCFWHSCPEHGSRPRANSEWWRVKLMRNLERDRDTDRRIQDAGWLVLRVWEHEDPAEAAARIMAAVRNRKSGARRNTHRLPSATKPADRRRQAR
jgi:DNA mismatch endonuclease (patch repair protein)